jgi:hypothetical protein
MATKRAARKSQFGYFVDLRRGTLASDEPTLDDLKQQVTLAEKQLQHAVDGQVRLRAKIRKARTNDLPDTSHTREFQKLLEHPLIEKISVDESIRVRTGMINIRHGGEHFQVGRFAFRIHPQSGRIYFENLTYKVPFGHQHPHIKNGVACWGNIGPVVTQLFAARQYAALVHVCIKFLQSYVQEDTHRPFAKIEEWPRVSSTVAQQYS